MAEAFINGDLLRWARERARLSHDALAAKLHVTAERLRSWEEGKARPTFRQAELFARAVHVPFGYLYLSNRPTEDLPIPDLRTHGAGPTDELGPDFRDLVRDVLFKQDWFREYLKEQDAEPVAAIGRFKIDAPVADVAGDIRKALRVDDQNAAAAKSWEEYLRLLMERSEEAGIWVMRSGIVGNNTHRPLSVDEFRGFAISDELAPLVFLNGKDAKAAQIFTLAHELAHLWIGASGVSNPRLSEGIQDVPQEVERYCNRVAAEVLLPQAAFMAAWNPARSLDDNAREIARAFKVSTVVVARRAFDAGLVSAAQHRAFYEKERQQWKQKDETEGGGDFYNTTPVRNGKRFTSAVLNEAMVGNLLFREASQLLNMKPVTLQKLYRKRTEGGDAVPSGF